MNIVKIRSDNEPTTERNPEISCVNMLGRKSLTKLICNNEFTSYFQPIISTASKEVFAYEGLCRVRGQNPFGSIEKLFEQARYYNEICALDMLCRENSIKLAAQQHIQKRDALLFLNVCPTSLQQADHSPGGTERLVQEWGLKKENVILEVTEQEVVSNYPLFLQAINHYRSCGFKIAIDDFGAGYGGLKMLSLLAPDYVKIDRHFIRDIDRAHINYSLIESVATICHRLGIDVIAEGIETENDMKICHEFDIVLLQGYYFAKPAARLIPTEEISIPSCDNAVVSSHTSYDEAICIEDIMTRAEPAHVHDRVPEVLQRFIEDPQLYCLPVLSGERVCGVINRHRFMENHMVGRHGYGINLNYYKKVESILDDSFLQFANHTPIEEVAKKINLRENIAMYDDICVTRSGKYLGMVAVGAILSAVTNKSIMYAKGANPLTGLPGNEFIQREIVKLLSQSIQFDVCYIDIDSFKPYNDKHGFVLGDEVIKEVGNIAVAAVQNFTLNNIGFAGHIGGDDFIVILRPKQSVAACEFIIRELKRQLPRFHTPEAIEQGGYVSRDRKGSEQEFPLLSLSICIVSTEVHHITSAAEVSSIASDLKKRAKAIKGSAIVRDRRVESWFESAQNA